MSPTLRKLLACASVASLVAACATTQQSALRVEPHLVPLAKESTLTLITDRWDEKARLQLAPGGPRLTHHIQLPGDWRLSSFHQTWLWRADTSGKIDSYELDLSNGTLRAATSVKRETAVTALTAVAKGVYFSDGVGVFFLTRNEKTPTPIDTFRATRLFAHEKTLCAQNERGELLVVSEGRPVATHKATGASLLQAIDDGCVSAYEDGTVETRATSGKTRALRTQSRVLGASLEAGLLQLAHGQTGLSYYDNRLQWQGSYNRLDEIQHIAAEEQTTLVADARGRLSLFDNNDPGTPLLQADFTLSEPIAALALVQRQALVRSGNQLTIIDFSVTSTPAISNLGVNLGGSRRSFLADDILYVADWFAGLHIYDVRNPNTPRLLSSYHTPGSPKGVLVRDGVAFVADDDHGLHVIDVHDLRAPKKLAELPLTGLAYTMKLREQYLYLASHRGGLHIIDVSVPAQPKLVGTYDTPGKTWAVALKGNLAFLADDNTGVVVLDVSQPRAPKLVHVYDSGGQAEDITLDGERAIVAYFDQGVQILDVRNPQDFKLITAIPTPGNARAVAIHGTQLTVAAWQAGVLLYDIANPSAPELLGHYDTDGAAWGVEVAGPYVYALDWWGGVKVLDFSDEHGPRQIAQYQASGQIHDVLLAGRFAYTASGHRGVEVFEATNPLNPVWATGVDLDGEALQLAHHESTLYVAAGDGGLAVIDISNPFEARWVGQLRLKHRADFIALAYPSLFVAERGGAVTRLRLDDPVQPRIERQWSVAVSAMCSPHPQRLVISDQLQQLQILDWAANARNPLGRVASLLHCEGERLISYHPRTGYTMARSQTETEIRSDSQVNAFTLRDGKLYSVEDHHRVRVVDMESGNSEAVFESSDRIDGVTPASRGLFFSGGARLTSMEFLPQVKAQLRDGQWQFTTPKGLPIGAYDLLIHHADGRTDTVHNAFEVGFPKPKTPRFTLDDLKKKLEQGKFEGKAP